MIELTYLKALMLIRQVNQKQCNVCHYWYFLDKRFKFQPDICNRCHNVLMMSMSFSDIAILNNNDADYLCTISRISKYKAVNLLQNIDLTKKNRTL